MRTWRFMWMIVAMLAAQMCLAQPMSGTYTIGDSDPNPDDYGSFTAAVSALTTLGVGGAVTFEVEEFTYIEEIAIGPISGASSENTITFRDAVPLGTRPKIKGGAAGSSGVVQLLGADYVTFDGIDIQDTVAGICIRIQDGAWYNAFKNLAITGTSVSDGSSQGCFYSGLAAQNGGNLFDNVTFNGCYYAILGQGSSAARDQGLEVRFCKINGCSRGVYIYDVHNARIHDNDISVGWVGATAAVTGVYIYGMRTGDSCLVYNNKIHGMQSTANATGITLYTAVAAGGNVLIYNNMIYGFVQPSGTGVAYGIEVGGGTAGLYYNSIFVDHVAATGNKSGITIAGTNAAVTMKNNIVVMGQTNTTANYGIYRTSGNIAASDFNCFYSSGGGTGYKMGYYVAARATLADWVAYFQSLLPPVDLDLNSVAGNPGYISATDPYDLHINADVGLVHVRGTPIAGITDDIDGNTRLSLPDIGADEYVYNAPSEDYWVRSLLGWTWFTPELTALTTDAVVVNRGTANQTNVPVVFFYDGIPQDTEYVSLNAYTTDTVTFNWTSPVAPDTILIEAQSFLTGDAVLANDSVLASVRIVKQPMAGTYTIGATRSDYTTFTAAVADLTLRGVSAAVVFEVAEGTYNEAVVIPAAITPVQYTGIRGASDVNTITFRVAPSHLDTPPEIASGTSPALNLNGADYITFDGINIRVTVAGKAVQIITGFAGYGGADYNTIKNCTLTGAGESANTNYGVHVTGGGNDYNVIDNVTVNRSAYYGVYLAGVTGARDLGSEVRNCTLIGGANDVTLTYQNGAVVRDCDIQPGYAGATLTCAGISCGTQAAGELATAYRNKIHNFTGTGPVIGISSGPGTDAFFRAYNNFVYDFNVTGTNVVAGLRAGSGTTEFYFNTVYIGNIATTGAAYGFNQVTLATIVTHLKNNVFRVDEPTTACWAIYKDAGTLYSDYNAFYSSGPGALYNLGYANATYPTIMDWQGAGLDAHSVEGDPGFVSATDLHIQPHYSLLNGAGIDTAGIASDIDSDGRGSPPEIGADEYAHTPMAHDYAATKWVDWVYTYVATVPVVIRAEVKNTGTSNETDVPVRLYYNGVQQDEVLLSLNSGQLDTVELDWTPLFPAVDQEIGTLVVKTFCPSDTFAQNDSIKVKVSVVGTPLSGEYDVGGGANHYATIAAAVSSLTWRGVSGAVTFNVYANTYSGSVAIGPIAGASETNTITFREAGTLDTPPEIVSGGSPALNLNGADYVTFDNIDITLTAAGKVVQITGNADYNVIKNCLLTGASQTGTGNYGVHVTGGGNDYNVVENVAVNRTVYYPVFLAGISGTSDLGIEVRNCTLIGGRQSVTLMYQNGAMVHDCDIQPGYDGATVQVIGIHDSSQTSGELSTAYGNRIHNIRGANITNGIYSSPGSGRPFKAYNNFVYDFVVTGTQPLYGLRVATGVAQLYFNSVRIGDVGTTGGSVGINGYYQAGGGSQVTFVNNIIQVGEPTAACWAINKSAGYFVTCDFNCVYGTGTGYNMGRDGTTNHATLASWQLATLRDSNSVEGDPGFISASDLHIDSLATLVDSRGTAIDGITDDIDGDLRGTPPDMGADEYDVVPEEVDSLTIFPDTEAGDAILSWAPAIRANSYKVYRGTTYDFVIDGTTYIGQTANTSYTDVGILATTGSKFYVVIASTDIIARGR